MQSFRLLRGGTWSGGMCTSKSRNQPPFFLYVHHALDCFRPLDVSFALYAISKDNPGGDE